jgi:hypothetical protein
MIYKQHTAFAQSKINAYVYIVYIKQLTQINFDKEDGKFFNWFYGTMLRDIRNIY